MQQDVLANAALQSTKKDKSIFKFQPKPVQNRKRTEQAETTATLSESAIFSIPAPMLRVQRCDNEPWELLPTACPFWNMLDLAPTHGPKSIKAFCLYPASQGLLRQVTEFMHDLKTAWQSSRLGSLRLWDDPDVDSAFVPVQLELGVSIQSAIDSYRSACLQLGKHTLRH